ncbi:MAG: putative 4-mercaptohistidine N1-methyltransferase [Campylobacterales bacterium]|nr:putative 4-mercaptohistidine N1-methyltransferase [Campylobacterales bacterium]
MKKINIYETDTLVAQYCDFQYGDDYFGVENFAKVCAQKAIKYTSDTKQQNALDLGCATGRASFELACGFEHVTGIDYSENFVRVGKELQRTGSIGYLQNGEGELTTDKKIVVDDYEFKNNLAKVTFFQGDACNLEPKFSGYDLIMATNLIDRLYEPQLFLKNIHERISSGGVLVLTSPYTWSEEYTAKEFWIGGVRDEKGVEISTLDGLKKILEENFDLLATEDVPFVIRETSRKFQHTISQMSVWRKR